MANKVNISFDIQKLKSDVLNFVESLRIPGSICRYKFTPSTDDTIFSSIFALFIKDLFKETDNFTEEELTNWITYIQSFQNKEHGYFEPEDYYHSDKERNRYQLTAFCLSALDILGSKPKYPLYFVDKLFPDEKSVERYLKDRGVYKGQGGSGNKAMFLAIFLTHQYELTSDEKYKAILDRWFDFHDRTQNPDNGYWGGIDEKYYHGFQNGFHQFIIYNYHNREVHYSNLIADNIIEMQNKDGSFSLIPGGEGCYDYDAMHTLLILADENKLNEVKLGKFIDSILSNQNGDGGFCQNNKFKDNHLVNYTVFLQMLNKGSLLFKAKRLKTFIKQVLINKQKNYPGWFKGKRLLFESNLWDTWFRVLILSEIYSIFENNDSSIVKFHDSIGIGFFKV